jgi:hypothetical protein
MFFLFIKQKIMNVNNMIDLAYDQTHTNEEQIDRENVLKYLNIVKNNFWSYMVSYMREKFNEGKFHANTIN